MSGEGARKRAETARRVRAALGPEPLDDAGHLLPPLLLAPPAPILPGPRPATQFVVDLLGTNAVTAERLAALLTARARAGLDFPKVWGRPAGRDEWTRPGDAPPDALFGTLALCWDLTGPGLPSDEATELAHDLGARFTGAARLATDLGRTAEARELPEAAARRAQRLADLRERFGRSIEMRLLPEGRAFPARAVWRAACALGLRWGDHDLFHGYDASGQMRLFALSALGAPGCFLPEHATEGAGVAGIGLSFDLPVSPAPAAVFDRMALALAFLRQKLGGRPVTAWGADLDADRLEAERDALEEMVSEMARANLAPGSPEAAALF